MTLLELESVAQCRHESIFTDPGRYLGARGPPCPATHPGASGRRGDMSVASTSAVGSGRPMKLPEMALPLLGAAPAFDSACPPPQATLSVRCGLRVQLSREPNGYMGFIQPCGEEIVNLFRILHFI